MPQPIHSTPADATSQTKATAGTTRRSKARYKFLGLLAVGTMIYYLVRTVLGIALSAIHSNVVEGRRGFGVFRM